MRISITFLLLFFATTIFFSQQQAPNILLIIADDMGIDSTPGFGITTDLPVTPTLDSFRQNGISFTNTWAAPQCSPTRAAIPFQTPPDGTYTTSPVDDGTTYLSMIENMDYEINRLLESMDDETLKNR
jgi:arylsulfatase A-like enzyme